jgi:chemotaxis signal transduction protein
MELIIFTVDNNLYALPLEGVERILQAQELTKAPNVPKQIDGMMSYNDHIIKVLNVRTMVGLQTYEDELNTLFTKLQGQHTNWVNTLSSSVNDGVPFTLARDAKLCDLGKWLSKFHSYDDTVNGIIRHINEFHPPLHAWADDVLELATHDKEKATDEINEHVMPLYNKIIELLKELDTHKDLVGLSLQKYILYTNKEDKFVGLKVDEIVDILNIDDSEINLQNEDQVVGAYMHLSGMIKVKGKLVSLIKTIDVPT